MSKVSFKQFSKLVDAQAASPESELSEEQLNEILGTIAAVAGGAALAKKAYDSFQANKEQKKLELLKKQAALRKQKQATQSAIDKKKDEIMAQRAAAMRDAAQKLQARGAASDRGPSAASRGRAAELDWLANMNESVMSNIDLELEELWPKIQNGDLDLYDIIAHHAKGVSSDVANYIQHRYDEIASNHHLHGDDDFEKILDILADELEADYGHREK